MPYQVQQLEPQKATDMVDVFISYSRKDIEFAQRLHHELEARDREPWVDWQGYLRFFSEGLRVKSRLQEMPIKARGLAASKRIGTHRTQALVFGTD